METRTEQDRRREAREKELEADLASAADLMGSTGVEDGAWACPVPIAVRFAYAN